MSEQVDGEPQTIWIEIGPLTFHGPSKASVRMNQMRVKRELDQLVRDYLRVGKRNAVVSTFMEADKKDGTVMVGAFSKQLLTDLPAHSIVEV